MIQNYHFVKVTMIEQRGECIHKLGDEFIYKSPMARPKQMCSALHGSLSPYIVMCSLGGKSWEKDDPDKWYISCPSKKGTVWKVEGLEEQSKYWPG
ncbi:MAG: TIGR04076 family protein [Candidatus Zixiibacteriota bacterium]